VAGARISHVFRSTIITTARKSKRGSSTTLGPLVITTSRPAFIAATVGAGPATGTARVWVTFGTVNSRVAINLTDYIDVTSDSMIFAKATFTTTGAFAISSWEIVSEAAAFEIPTPTGPRPDTGYYSLGSILFVDDVPVISNSGSGSLDVWPQISNSLTGSSADSSIVWSRNA